MFIIRLPLLTMDQLAFAVEMESEEECDDLVVSRYATDSAQRVVRLVLSIIGADPRISTSFPFHLCSPRHHFLCACGQCQASTVAHITLPARLLPCRCELTSIPTLFSPPDTIPTLFPLPTPSCTPDEAVCQRQSA